MIPAAPSTRTSGQAFLELAIALPVLLLLLFATYDFSCSIRAQNVISNMSREGANLVSRSSYADQDILNAIAFTAQPLDMQHNGMMYVTQIQGSVGGSPTIISQSSWQNSSLQGTVSSKIGTWSGSSGTPAQNIGSLTLSENQTAVVLEVFYNYQTVFSINGPLLDRQLYAKSIFLL